LVPSRDEPRPVEEPEVLSGVEVDRSTGLDDEHRLGRDEDRLGLRNDDHGLRLGSDDDRRPRRWRRADADTDAQVTGGRGWDVLSIATAESVTTPDSLANPFLASPLRRVRSRGAGEVPSVQAQVSRVYGGI